MKTMENENKSRCSRYSTAQNVEEGQSLTKEELELMHDSLEKRYGLALFNVGRRCNRLSEINNDLIYIKNNLFNDTKFVSFWYAPNVTIENKLKYMQEYYARDHTFDAITLSFLNTVLAFNRTRSFITIMDEFFLQMANEKNEVPCIVYSAKDLNPQEKQSVLEAISMKLEKGAKPKIECRLDQNLGGGILIKIGNDLYDSSSKLKMDTLRRTLMS